MIFLPDLNNQLNQPLGMDIDLNVEQQEEHQQEVIFNPAQPVGDIIEMNDMEFADQEEEEIEIQQPEVPQP